MWATSLTLKPRESDLEGETAMKFFLDTANLEEIRTVHRWGILDGITTNPTLVSREGMDYRTVVREIASITSGPISVETTSDKADEMIQQGKDYVTWAALAGAHIATIPFKVVEQLFKHPLTELGQERFLTDWRKLQSELERRKTKV